MIIDSSLANASDALIVSATVVYTVAMLAFVADLVSTGRASRTITRQLVTAGASGPATTEAVAEPPGTEASVSSPASRIGRIAVTLFLLGTGLHLASVVARGAAVGRVPWSNAYEFATTGALAVSLLFAGLLLRREVRWLGAFVALPIVLTLGVATAVFYAEASDLAPALQSFWLVIHVSVAFIASALFTVGFSLSVLQLVQHRFERQGARPAPTVLRAVPSATVLEAMSFRLHAAGFVLWTFTLVAGAIWAEHAWGRYWGWDPKEVWSLVIWVVYAAYLHARSTAGWGGRGAAWVAVAAYGCLLFNFFGVNYLFVGNHSYAG